MRGRLVPTDIDSSPTPESVAPLVRSADNNLATSSTEWEQPADTAVPLLVVVSCGIRRRGGDGIVGIVGNSVVRKYLLNSG